MMMSFFNSPERHIYSTIAQVLPSIDTRAAPPTTDSQQLSQLYHTSTSDSVHNSDTVVCVRVCVCVCVCRLTKEKRIT